MASAPTPCMPCYRCMHTTSWPWVKGVREGERERTRIHISSFWIVFLFMSAAGDYLYDAHLGWTNVTCHTSFLATLSRFKVSFIMIHPLEGAVGLYIYIGLEILSSSVISCRFGFSIDFCINCSGKKVTQLLFFSLPIYLGLL